MKIYFILIFSLIKFFSVVYTSDEVTYPRIGHFTTKDFYDPKYRPIVFLPLSPEHIGVRFLLYTRSNEKNEQLINYDDHNSIKNSNFNGKNPTKFIVHGFIDNQLFGDWMRTMKDEFLLAGDYNVIIVDWSGGNGLPYTQATANTRVVGPVIALLIDDLKTIFGLKLSDVHILGHSLGSHVAGYAGLKMNGSLGRLTGLDPAGPYFEGLTDPEAKLDSSDAIFVDAIHTDAQPLIPDLGFGMYETSGHLDFYPNGGHNQPGCDQQRWTSVITDGLIEGARRFVACCHQRAVDFYINSINEKNTKGVSYQCQDYDDFGSGKCVDCGPDGDKCAILGDDAILSKKYEKSTRGNRFFLTTADKTPFFRHVYAVQVKLPAPTEYNNDGKGVITVTLKGSKSDIQFPLNSDEETFHLGQTYSFVQSLDNDVGDVISVTFRWHRVLGVVLRDWMYIESITVVPLSSDNVLDKEKHSKEVKTFCSMNPKNGIENDKDIDFANDCKLY